MIRIVFVPLQETEIIYDLNDTIVSLPQVYRLLNYSITALSLVLINLFIVIVTGRHDNNINSTICNRGCYCSEHRFLLLFI